MGKRLYRGREMYALPLVLSLPFTLGNRGGANSDGCLIGNLTHTAVGKAFLDDGGSYTDDTTDINDVGGADVALTPATPADGDNFYFGYSDKFAGIVITTSTAGAPDPSTDVEWQYWNGSAWTALSAATNNLIDSSAGFSATAGKHVISFTPPSDWEEKTVNSSRLYWIRFHIGANSKYGSAVPVATQGWLLPTKVGSGLEIPVTGTITDIFCHANTNSGTNADSVFQLINITRGFVETFTWTKGTPFKKVTDLSLGVNAGDSIVLMMLKEDGSTEYADVTMYCHLELL